MNMFTKKPDDEAEGENPNTTAKTNDKPDESKVESTDEVQYACRGIPRLKIGRFQFEAGVLRLSPEDDEAFTELLSGCDPSIRQAITKVDRTAGDAVAKAFLDRNGGRMIRGGDDTSQSVPAPRPSEG